MASGRRHPMPDIKLRLIISLAVAVCVFLFTNSGAFNTFDVQLSDRVYQSESVNSLPITIVRIDEKTLTAMQSQPSEWSRQVYADLLDKLNESERRPAVIAFDLMFTGHKSDTAGDIAFAEAAKKYGNVIAGTNASFSLHQNRIESIAYPYEELREAADEGLVNCTPDRYDYVTSAYTGMRFDGKWHDSLAVSILKKFADYVKSHPEYANNHPEYADISVKDYSAEETNRYRFSYSVASGNYDCVSMIDILDGTLKGSDFANSIVMVGAYAPGLQDDFPVLFSAKGQSSSRMYGVEIHANITQAIYEGRLQTEANRLVMAAVYALICGLICFLLLRTGIVKGVLLCLGTALLYIIVSVIFYKNGVYILLLKMLLCCVLLGVGAVVYHYLSARYEKQKINKAFRMYVAPEIVDDVAGSGSYELQLGGRHKDIAVLFVDIRGFTTMSENLAPEEVVDILNEYFGVITDAIFKNKGTLDKFIGDAAMAVFNSPFDLDDYVYRAVMTACDIAKASEALGEKLMERFGKKVSYGIGVNCGEAIIGNIGSTFRMDYTAIGDTVNTASRLESNAKAGEILISEEVKKRLEGRIETEDVGEIPLKGKSRKIFVYRVKL
ncbi:MAG: adenylate/guanylate cyclase domain-containing protein [Lachnospiraceae bacterium]|nr:adenylate/guanylate cyclase domain-containing protein [Lachnospiraceae bacterium]